MGRSAPVRTGDDTLGRMLRRFALALSIACGLFASFAACSDDESTGSTPSTNDGGADAQPDSPPAVVTNDSESKQTGKIIRAQSEDDGVPGATVTAGGNSVTTNATGEYEIIVPRNTPYRMTVAAPEYFKLLEQEMILTKETLDRGKTNLLPTETATFLAGLLPDRKAEKGLVVVKVNPLPPCTSEEGSTLSIDPPGEAKITYFNGSLPQSSLEAVKAGSTFSAAIYNVEVGVPLTITVTSPQCSQAPFPIDVGDVTYTGALTAEAGEALSYMRVYIKDAVIPDAGSD